MNLIDLFFGAQPHLNEARYTRPRPVISARRSEQRLALDRAIALVGDAADLAADLKGREYRLLKRALSKL